MNIVIPVPIKISGKVQLWVMDHNRNTKDYQHFNNSIHNDLKAKIGGSMQGNSATDYIVSTSSGWFDSTYPDLSCGGEDGIYITQTGRTASGSTENAEGGYSLWDLFLDENKSQSVSNNVCSWTAEATWTGTNGSGTNSSGTFDRMQIGNGYIIMEETDSSFDDHFTTVYATAIGGGTDFSNFSLDDNDIARVTWQITIG